MDDESAEQLSKKVWRLDSDRIKAGKSSNGNNDDGNKRQGNQNTLLLLLLLSRIKASSKRGQ